MRINLYTDAPYYNLALMQLSAHHKAQGNSVTLNMPIMPCDYSYASILFEKNRDMFDAHEWGGPAYEHTSLSISSKIKPDYSLFPIKYSLGYTFRPCFRKCPFCKVWKMSHPDTRHHSIWEFHDPRFKTICLLNNNTFFDPQWKETFEEIWDADLTLKEHGFDLRLIDEEKADALRRTKVDGRLHYAWDRIEDEAEIMRGLSLTPHGSVYVLIGYDTTEEHDIYRVQKIVDAGFDPYIMPYNQTWQEKRFKRFVDSFMWRKYRTIGEAWRNYKP